MKLLIVKTSSLGDVVHNLPIINDINHHYPDAIIDWVVEESFAEIPRMHTRVNHVIPIALRRWRKHLLDKSTWREIREFKHLITTSHYDAIIDTQGLLKSALISSQANGIKHGYDRQSIREPLASYFYHQKYTVSYQQHAVIRNRTLAALSLAYTPPETSPDYGIKAPENSLELPRPFIIALHGTSRDSKLWPTDHWITFGKLLAGHGLNMVLPWAGKAELSRANQIAQALPNAHVLTKSSIATLAAVIAQSQAAVGVDTGLSHLAAALNKPIVAIYTDTNPALTGVMAGALTPAINLGGINLTPSPHEVFKNLLTLIEY
ncbi:MAG: lipopolysaccharide heptosyltransferase I [Betaproteobacteria bacterium HGW-Betaproteobacteria-20]|nr:MAG: lipopolysaccharide heptosyltransferase I [Betaproteobacteria bacterium HGW-Betaproteobacteria-20]